MIEKLELTVSFTTPAFLGNADQQAQWRTPPFKTLIRQWWRVVKANTILYAYKGNSINDLHNKILMIENNLFGTASEDSHVRSGRSRLNIRLSKWNQGTMSQWESCGNVYHPDARGGRNIGADLYLGYGPLIYEKGSTVLSRARETNIQRTAIMPVVEKEKLTLSFPSEYKTDLLQALQLIVWFGTIGGRSRNGWGSLMFNLSGNKPLFKPLNRSNLQNLNVCRSLEDCLRLDWPHAVGKDDKGPLVWKTKVQGDWRSVIKELARIKIAFRTNISDEFSFRGKTDGQLTGLHILAYPVTHHAVLGWERENGAPGKDKQGYYIQSERLANQIRFKVIPAKDNKVEGVIVHMPCGVPKNLLYKLDQFSPSDKSFIQSNESAIWKEVHKILDREAIRLR